MKYNSVNEFLSDVKRGELMFDPCELTGICLEVWDLIEQMVAHITALELWLIIINVLGPLKEWLEHLAIHTETVYTHLTGIHLLNVDDTCISVNYFASLCFSWMDNSWHILLNKADSFWS